MLKREKARRTGKQAASKSVRQAQAKKKTSARNRKPARRTTMFKTTSWYERVAQSIAIAPRAAS